MNLAFAFHHRKGDFQLGAEGDWPLEGVTALFGPSGCGKSTFLRSVAGLERGRGNRMSLGGEVYQDGRRWIPPHRRAVGMVFQRAGLFPHLNVQGNLNYGLRRRKPAGGRTAGPELLSTLGVIPLLKRRVGELSGGERQRVAMARALMAEPDVLLMDEPLAALDDTAKNGFLHMLEGFSREARVPILLVTHSLEEVARLADRVAVMQGGQIREPVAVARALGDPRHGMVRPLEARVVLDSVVRSYEPADGLIAFDSPAGCLRAPGPSLPKGTRVRLRIHARDIAIGLGDPGTGSPLNHLPGEIVTLADASAGLSLVRVRCGQAVLPALITRHSVRRLDLRPGQRVTAQFKSAAILNGVMG